MTTFHATIRLLTAILTWTMIAWNSASAQATDPRVRRIIYNDDDGEVKHMATPDIEAMLDQRVRGLLGTQVDTVFYNGQQDFAKAFYDSDIEGVEIIGDAGLREALANGVDPSGKLIGFCRSNGLEIFWSFRMNDIHDSYDRNLGKFKRDHPEYLLGSKDVEYSRGSVKAGIWSSMDYAAPQIRSHVMAFIEEVCGRYELDGVEFDYCRNASLFRPTFEGRTVGPEHLAILTKFHRRLRTMANGIAKQKGRPFLLAASVPDNVKLCRFVGIDIETWLKEGLLDILIVGNGRVPFTMANRELIDLGHRHGVQVYPRIDINSNTGGRIFWQYREAWHAAAVNSWQCGGDGIYLFNAFDAGRFGHNPLPTVLRQIGDPQTLVGLDKLFAVDVDLGTVGIGNGDLRFYTPRENLVPMSLAEPDRFVRFHVGEDLIVAPSPTVELRLMLQGFNTDSTPAPQFQFNGQPLGNGSFKQTKPGAGWFTFSLDPAQVMLGDNKITGSAGSGQSASAVLSGVELWIRQTADKPK